MRSSVRTTVFTLLSGLVLAAGVPAPVSPLPDLPSERRDGITYIPEIDRIGAPSALDSQPPDNSDHVRYDEFASPLASAEEAAGSWEAESLPEPVRDTDVSEFDDFIPLLEERDSELGEVRVGALPRRTEVAFAVMESDSEEYDATVWSSRFSYAVLYVEVNDSVWLLDIGSVYDLHLAEGAIGAVADEAEEVEPSHEFLPAAPEAARLSRFESLDDVFIDVRAKTLISLDKPAMEPASVRLLLRVEDEELELAGLFITHLSYPSGSTYTLHLEETDDARGILREHMLSAASLTAHTTRYQLSIAEHTMFRGRFVGSDNSTVVWEDTFPHSLVVAEREAGLYDEPRGEQIDELPQDTQVRAVEPWDRLDSRDGVDGMWYRVEAGSEEGWMWAPNLAAPESREE